MKSSLALCYITKDVDLARVRQLEAMARRMEPALRNAFLTAIRRARNAVSLDILEQSIRSTDPAAAIREATHRLEFTEMREAFASLVLASGAKATQQLANTIEPDLIAGFDIFNPYAAGYAKTEVGNLITAITQTTQEGIQAVIENAVATGVPPRLAARQIRDMIGLTEQQTNWTLNYELRLLDAGAANIDEKVGAYVDKLIGQRALMISRSETLRAVNGGQQAAWNAAVDQGVLPADAQQRWITTHDKRICPICEPMDGQTVPLNADFVGGNGERTKKPPIHPRCRCSVALDL